MYSATDDFIIDHKSEQDKKGLLYNSSIVTTTITVPIKKGDKEAAKLYQDIPTATSIHIPSRRRGQSQRTFSVPSTDLWIDGNSYSLTITDLYIHISFSPRQLKSE